MSVHEYKHKRPPMDHQRRVFLASRGAEYFALTMDMGTGKTMVCLDTMAWLYEQGKINGALIIAPKGPFHQWAGEQWELNVPDRVAERANVYLWSPSSSQREAKDRKALLETGKEDLAVAVMNVEAFATTKGVAWARAFLSYREALIVLDESSTIGNPKAKRTKALLTLAGLSKYRRIATGTPADSSPLAVWSQYNFLSPDILGNNFYTFRSRYAVLQKSWNPQTRREFQKVTGYRRIEELRRKVAPHTYRVTQAECLDLPKAIYQRRHVEMSTEQRRAYESACALALIELSDETVVTMPMVLTRILRLRQILCGFVGDDEGKIHWLEGPDNRLAELMQVVSESGDRQAIIWGGFRPAVAKIVEALKKAYGKEAVGTLVGGATAASREETQDRFNDRKDPMRYLVGTVATGKFGLNLTAATLQVYYANDFSLETRRQSERRILRKGQTKPVTYVDLICPGTVDEQILEALLSKLDLASEVTGDAWQQWFRETRR